MKIGEKAKVAVALTATIEPSEAIPNLLIRHPSERLGEYLKSIQWWSKLANQHGFDLFVFENSGRTSDLSKFESESVSVVPAPIQDPTEVIRGKGAGESLILSFASKVLCDYALVLKCTGRLQVLNAPDLLSRHLSVPSAQVMISWNANFSQVDTRCFSVRPAFLREWMSAIESEVSDDQGFDLESQSAGWLLTQILAGHQIMDFSRSPAIVGRSGSEGVSYSQRKARARLLIEGVVRGRLRTDPR